MKQHLPRTQEKLERACLEQHCDRSLRFCDWSRLKFVFIDRRSWNSECPGLWYHWYLSWLASQTTCIDTESGTISRRFEILQKFWERSAIWFTYIDELKIKYFFKFYISQTLIFTGFFDFNSLIECLKVNRVYVTSFSFHSRLVLEK